MSTPRSPHAQHARYPSAASGSGSASTSHHRRTQSNGGSRSLSLSPVTRTPLVAPGLPVASGSGSASRAREMGSAELGRYRGREMERGSQDLSPTNRPAVPSSRMALSALVNSPPPLRSPSIRADSRSPTFATGIPASSSRYAAYPTNGHSSHSHSRYMSPVEDATYTYPEPPAIASSSSSRPFPPHPALERVHSSNSARSYDDYEDPHRLPQPVYRSPSPPYGAAATSRYYDSYTNGARPPAHDITESRRTSLSAGYPGVPTTFAMRLNDRLIGNEEVWEEGLQRYQKQREAEVAEISNLDPSSFESVKPADPFGREDIRSNHTRGTLGGAGMNGNNEADSSESRSKPKGWPANHPTRIALREAKEAAIAAGLVWPKRKPNKGRTNHNDTSGNDKKQTVALDDELLGLAEGQGDVQAGPSSPAPYSDDDDERDDDRARREWKREVRADGEGDADLSSMSAFNPDAIVEPCGLTRAEVIRRIEANVMIGLTETDVKAVQDEMWMRKKATNAAIPVNKDGTMRRKPGPAKGWKKLREGGSSRFDFDDRSEGTSNAGETINGEADADIAALLGEGDPGHGSDRKGIAKAKRRKIEEGVEEITRYADSEDDPERGTFYSDEEDGNDSRRGDVDNGIMGNSARKSGGGGNRREGGGGTGKGKSSRQPITKPEKDLLKKAEALAVQSVLATEDIDEGYDLIPGQPVIGEIGAGAEAMAALSAPNTEDPRGVSEHEARIRLGLVEELERQAWAGIVRDIPRMYRVYQAYDSVVKQDAQRTIQAALRNAFSQRAMKPTFKSTTRINKDAASKAKRVIKEMLLYWRKNEKDELAARKKADKEALDRAKAEEEARESKRQARKLNFLLTQTELYSHFIGKKIKTHEAEDTAEASTGPPEPKGAEHVNEEIGIGADGEVLPDIDYDDDDEENLRRHAARGAQAAVQAAKDRAKAFDDARPENQQPLDLDGDELNFQNPSMGQDQVTITQPKMLMAQLKEYQLKGLTWLGNLYEQGINGILADEMGLGKTIQSISLLAYLAEHHNLWGPFLVIAPSSTLHNWQQELARFVPRLKALPYWGSPKDRETLRKIWSRKNMTFSESSGFHILVTSYQLAVQDEKYFQGTKWQYMILDEAQAIKSSSSARWKSLLSLHCRNRLLLTGTPIQNSMHELWALLHFIMPSLFDSHEEFSEWFSKDIENAAGGSGDRQLKPEQLRRLHMILKPFMLRRVKKHVQKELGDKIEIDLLVDLSQRQRAIYKALRQRVSVSDLIAQANNLTDSLGAKNLMNLVMQFRKVCNHPDLFERADVVSPYMFGTFSQSGNLARQGDLLYCPDSAKNAIDVELPRIVWEDGKLDRPSEQGKAGSDTHILKNLMSIWNPSWINESLKEDKENRFGWTKLLDVSPSQVVKKAKSHPLVSLLENAESEKENIEQGIYRSDSTFAAAKRFAVPARLPDIRPDAETPLREIASSVWNRSYLSRRSARFAIEHAVAPLIRPSISTRSFINTQTRLESDPLAHTALYGLAPSEVNSETATSRLSNLLPPSISATIPPQGLLAASPASQSPLSSIKVPAFQRLIVDSAKLARLDDLLRELKDGGHRVLLYFQMTRMMDLAEEYLIYRQYKYLRLDGASPIGERRDMVTSWQTNPDIFVFCLSTRAGGLGINLTAADTVIFYDHDWNPSNDAQAMDRAHRVGQTKQVTVYRLIARGTIEERIVNLARAKKDVQDIVVGTKSLTDVAKPSEIVSLFMDDEELAESVAKRKQAEAHGYVAPTIKPVRSAFGDGLGLGVAVGVGGGAVAGGDDDEDDFFSLARKVPNAEGEDDDEMNGGRGGSVEGGSGAGTPKAGGGGGKDKKRKADGPAGPKRSHKKKVKIALGPDGLPI